MVTCQATDACNNQRSASFPVTVYTSLRVHKFYDTNVNGQDDDGSAVAGFKMVLSGGASATQYTDAGGNTTFTGLLPGNYTVTEVLPSTSWVSTTGGVSQTVTGLSCPTSLNFGNYCFSPPTQGLTIGFWTNKNGQNKLQAQDQNGGSHDRRRRHALRPR